MTLELALDRIGADPGDDEAVAVVERFVHAAAAQRCRDPMDAEDIAQDVLLVVLERLARGGLGVRSNAGALLRIMVRNRVIALHRARQATGRRERDYADEHGAVAPEPVSEAPGWALLERLAEAAIALRAPQSRGHAERAWREVKAVCAEGRALREIVAELEGLAPADPVPPQVMRAAYTRHKRFRADLARALEVLAADGVLDAHEQEHALLILGALVYCHKSPPRDGLGT